MFQDLENQCMDIKRSLISLSQINVGQLIGALSMIFLEMTQGLEILLEMILHQPEI